MSEAGLDEVRLPAEPLLGLPQLLPEMLDALTADVLELYPLQVPPHAFIWIELGRVGGEMLHLNPLLSHFVEECLHFFAPVDGSAVPKEEELLEVAHQMPEEVDDLSALDGALVLLGEQPPIWCNGRDGREVISGEWHPYHRRLSYRSIGSSERRQQVEGGFIQEHNRPSLRYALS